jgi:hypothetical protein
MMAEPPDDANEITDKGHQRARGADAAPRWSAALSDRSPTRVMRAAALALALAATGTPALACELPNDGTSLPRRMVARVKYLPEIEAWAEQRTREGALVQYLLELDKPVRRDGHCWYPVEVRADGKLWRRFLVASDRARVMEEIETSGAKARNRR